YSFQIGDNHMRDYISRLAIIGMAGRFPGAKNVDQFWKNLCDGVESITFFTEDQLDKSLIDNPNYVRAASILEDIDLFDASFFGYSPREAEMMDPQHRLFLECAWEALENAGYDAKTTKSSIGTFAGVGSNSYIFNLYSNTAFLRSVGYNRAILGNDKDFLTTRVSYKLNLIGPSVVVQSACSTSLVAVHLSCQSLLNHECDMALAGGVSVHVRDLGYYYDEDGILSPDGHTRTFDAKAQGTIGGSGVGIVVLKRLEDALADGDFIYAVIRGSAINNDGSFKVGYTAPSIDGQAQVIRAAQL